MPTNPVQSTTELTHPATQISPPITGRTVNMQDVWEFLPKTEDIRNSSAPNKLAVGSTGSGKTSGLLMHAIIDYALRWDGCAVLCLRATYKELESGMMSDFKTYLPEGMYTFNETKKTATLINGSKVVFGHLATGQEKDLKTYLGSSYVVILVDECAQFSFYSWLWMQSRNRVNPECKPNAQGEYPLPVMLGCTNPTGPYWTE
jgi:hypothetical protein